MNLPINHKFYLILLIKLLLKIKLFPVFIKIVDSFEFRTHPKFLLKFPHIKKEKDESFQILTYHQVNDNYDPIFTGVPIKVFKSQMEVLRKHFNVLSLDEIMQRYLEGSIPSRCIAITFDDGYYDNYTNAYPILKNLGLPATIFLTTGTIGSKYQLWHERIFNAFRQTEKKSMVINYKLFSLVGDKEKRNALDEFLKIIRVMSPMERDKRIEQLYMDFEIANDDAFKTQMLNWDHVKEMAGNGITFGAHTVTHPILNQMKIEDATNEIIISKEAIEKRVSQKVNLFAYPNGRKSDFNESIKKRLAELGFSCAVTTIWGTNKLISDPFELCRLSAWDDDPSIFLLRLGWYKLMNN